MEVSGIRLFQGGVEFFNVQFVGGGGGDLIWSRWKKDIFRVE